MKIVIINGSPRKNGSTAFILHQLEDIFLQNGAEVIFYNLSEQNISFCKGCCACYNLGKCVIDDDADMISAQLCESDGIIIGTSTIASNVSGVLKSFIDRGHFVIEQLLNKKYAVCVTTYENYGGNDALKVLKSLVTLSGAYLSGAFSIKLPFNSDYRANNKINNLTNKYAEKLFNDISKKRFYPTQNMIHKLVITFGLKAFVIGKGDKYSAVRKRWEEINII